MNKILTVIFVFFISNIGSGVSQELFDLFNFYRVTSNFYGVQSNGQSIIVYGSGGVIIRSIDFGKSWKTIQVEESQNLVSSITIGKNYYLLSDKCKIFVSNDNGESWIDSSPIEDSISHKMILNDNKIFVLCRNKIYVLDDELKKIMEYTISIDTNYFDFGVIRKKIVFPSGKGKINVIDLLSHQQQSIDLKSKGICTDCDVPKILCASDNYIFLSIKSSTYKFDGNDFLKIADPPSLSGVFATKNDVLFEVFSQFDSESGVDRLYFYKIDYANSKNIKINTVGYDRYIRNAKFNFLTFLSNDTIYAVGNDKLVIASYDGGVTWKVISNFVPTSPTRFGPTYACAINQYAQFFVTRDGGTTWLPQKNFVPDMYSLEWYGNSFCFDTSLSFLFKHYLFDYPNFVVTRNGGDTVEFLQVPQLYGYQLDYLTTPQAIKYWDKLVFTFPGYVDTSWKYSFILLFNNNFELERRIFLDSVHILFLTTYKESEILAVAKYYKSNDQGIHLLKSLDTCNSWVELMAFNFLKPEDSPTSTFPFKQFQDKILFFFNRYSGSMKFKGTLFLIDVTKLTYTQLFSEDLFDILSALVLDNYIVLSGGKFSFSPLSVKPYIIKGNFDDSSQNWQDITPKIAGFDAFYTIGNGNYFALVGTKFKSKQQITIWFSEPKNPSGIEVTEVKQYNIFVSTPEPNPAKDNAIFRIWWDKSLSIEQVKFKISDFLGNTLENQMLTFTQYNDYYGIVNWKIRNIENGVYFLLVSIGGITKAVPVLIF